MGRGVRDALDADLPRLGFSQSGKYSLQTADKTGFQIGQSKISF